MKTFRHLITQVSLLVALLAVTTATNSAAAQDVAPPPPDQQQAYPADQAPPPPADQAPLSTGDQSAYPIDQTPPSAGSAYPSDQAPPSTGQPLSSDGDQTADPSGRVARLGYMTGSVSVQPQGTGDWVQGSLNRPLTNADNVWADKDSRAELNLGTGVMRISSETSLTLTNVTNDVVQVELHQGTLNVHVRKLYGGETYEIDTPNQAFTVTKSGEYRFDVDPTGDTTLVTVWKGEGEATGQGPSVRVHEGQQARFSNGTSLAHQISDAPGRDGFDDWCKVRDKHEDESVSARYVAPGVVGASDLDEYGSWRDVPEYGNVWVPTSVAPGWAPYSTGHWIWQAPWGWTWVDDAPWGFAPFHYGRWVGFDGYWGWAPGPYWERPFYAPALVAWFGGPGFGIGFGGGFGFGFGIGGGFGWCPLGFGEPFFPWYGGGRGYFRNINLSNTRINNFNHISNNYFNNRNLGGYGKNGIGTPRYASRPGALTAVSRNTLEHGLPVARNRANISPSALRNLSSASIGRPNASPTRASMLGPKAGLPAAHPSGATFSRPTVSRLTPPRSLAKPSPAISSSRNGTSVSARGGAMASRPAQNNMGNRPAAMPNRGASNSTMANRNAPQMATNRNVPRPPQGGVKPFAPPSSSARPGGMNSSARTSGMNSSTSRSVPRPPADSFSRPATSARNTFPSASRSSASPYGRGMSSNVPRPSGRVQPAPRNYPSAQSRGNYSARSYGSGAYGGSRGYSGSPYGGSRGSSGSPYGGSRSSSGSPYGGSRSSSGSPYGGSRSSSGSPYGGSSSRGSFGGRGYSAPSHSSGSFGGYRGSSGSHGGGSVSHSGGGGSSHGGGGSHSGGGSHGGSHR